MTKLDKMQCHINAAWTWYFLMLCYIGIGISFYGMTNLYMGDFIISLPIYYFIESMYEARKENYYLKQKIGEDTDGR